MSTATNSVLPLEPEQASLHSLRWVPYLILLAAAAVLLVFWSRIPEQWAVHWGVRGEADRWASKTPLWVFGFLLLGGGICVFLEGIGQFVKTHRSRSRDFKISPQALGLLAQATVGFVRMMSIAVALLMALMAVKLPLYPRYEPTFTVVTAFIFIFTAIGLGIARLLFAFRRLKRAGMLTGAEGWNGLFYSNPEDPRLWVEKLIGLGYTLNFAHRAALPVFISLIALPILVIVMVLIMVAR